jgi:hypothetical protein
MQQSSRASNFLAPIFILQQLRAAAFRGELESIKAL